MSSPPPSSVPGAPNLPGAPSAARPVSDPLSTSDAAYFAAVRLRIDPFVAQHFGLRGTLRLHKAALGRDILRAPLNVILSPVLLLTRLLGWLCSVLRLRRAARWLRARRILLRTEVAARVETGVVRHVLGVALPQGEAHDTRTLSRAIQQAPVFSRGLRAKGEVAAANATANSIARAIAEYSGARSAVADISTALIALAIGGLVFQALTPGMISIAPGLARTIALETAVAGFPLGAGAGSLWYGVFTPGAPPWLVAANVAGLVMVGSVIGAFAGVIADPLQARLGLHRRRLRRFVDAVEDDLVGSGTKGYAAPEHFYARVMDLWDAGMSAWRVFRS